MKHKTLAKFATTIIFLMFFSALASSVSLVHAQQVYTAYAYDYIYGSGGTYTITDITTSTSSSGVGSTSLLFNEGDALSFEVTPVGGQVFSFWSNTYTYYYTNPVVFSYWASDISMSANFTGSGINTYYINATADVHSTITPTGLTAVTQGNTQSFNWTVSPGYFISKVQVDNNPNIGRDPPYPFINVQLNHTITISTEPITTGNYQYAFYGPYFDDGTISTNTVTATAYWVNGNASTFSITGPFGSYMLSANSPVTTLAWNASSTLNETRIINFMPTPTIQSFHLFITNPNNPSFIYTFPILDFAGMENGYLETQVTTGTTSYTVEQANINQISSPNFVMQQYQTYTLTFLCDKGSYSQQFTAGTTLTTNLNVPPLAFPLSNLTYPTCDAERFNSSGIAVVYVDPSLSTNWATTTITHIVGSTTINDYYINTTGNTQTILWNEADQQTSYSVTFTASINNATSAYGILPTWQFAIGTMPPANPFLGVFDFLGQNVPTLPYTPTGWTGANGSQLSSGMIAELVGMAVIMLFLGIGSYRSSGEACIIAWLMSGILIYLGWWANGVTGGLAAIPSFAICGVVAIFIVIGEAKQVEREV